MADSVVFNRRDFLKLVGLGVAGAAAGCSTTSDRLIPYLVQPNDVLPGIANYYASTCRECASGCGILIKQREGRAIKLEGNAAHPIGQGGLCARGHAGLQGLYDPDRLKTPMLREGNGWKAITWDEAMRVAGERLGGARGKLALVTANVTGSLHKLAAEWAQAGGGTHLVYEPFAYESLREANRRTFGQATIPNYDFSRARSILSFGADFLETWLRPVDQARGFAAARARADAGRFVAIEPRLSLTGANADEWVAVRPGAEMALALGFVHVIVSEGLAAGGPDRGAVSETVASYTPEAVEAQTGVSADDVRRLARGFVAQRPSLAVAGGIAAQTEQSVALHAAVNLLNYVAGNVGETVRFDRTLNYDSVASFAEVQRLIASMGEGAVSALVVAGPNPVYGVPAWAGFAAAMDKVPFKIGIATALDETAARCDLLLPANHALEDYGDVEAVRGVHSIVQPGMKPVPAFDGRSTGDSLIGLAKSAGFGDKFPAAWTDYLGAQWRGLQPRFGAGKDFDGFWRDTLQRGGWWEDVAATPVRWTGAPVFAAAELKGPGDFALVLYPTSQLYDGRGANKSWLQELPDPTTKAVWGTWAEIHPETAKRLGVIQGQPLHVETEAGAVDLPAYIWAGVRKDVVAIPLGQGHTAYGRYAKDRGVNATSLLPPAQDAASGAVAYLSAKAKVTRGTKAMDLVVTQREKIQSDRKIGQVIPVSALLATAGAVTIAGADSSSHAAVAHAAEGAHAAAGAHGGHGVPHGAGGPMGSFPGAPSQTKLGKFTEPMAHPEGYVPPAHSVSAAEPEYAVRSPRQNPVDRGTYKHAKHRWAMAVDLNSCTGCAACVVACNAENNIPTVGTEPIKRGREMHWIRIERYEEKVGGTGEGASPNDVRFVPMMCQHCSDAPCETVCPVYATYHNPEGLNAQVYNRCVGTRYCSNNCPYKVRTFNFFDYSAPEKPTFAFPEPLNWQLNPDVTVRSKGVMEKCTMCVQRILEGKGHAKDEERELRDGEIKTACQQSCPTQAIVFGDLLDENSEVSKLSHGERRYWVLNDLNTKPGVTYLKKLQRETV